MLPRDELGNRAAFCAGCGWGRRFLAGVPVELPEQCPDCGAAVRKPAGERIVELLTGGGVRTLRLQTP